MQNLKRKDIFVMSRQICLSDQITRFYVFVICIPSSLTYAVPHHEKCLKFNKTSEVCNVWSENNVISNAPPLRK